MTETKGITKKVGRCGGSACIRDTRIPVWGLVERRRMGQLDSDILRALPDLTIDDLMAAWEYAAAHPEEIELSLWENEVCMVSQEDPRVEELIRRGRRLGLSDQEIGAAFEPPLADWTVQAAGSSSGA